MFTGADEDLVAGDLVGAVGLRLGADAARELSEPATLAGFRRWLDAEQCYVFTINGFPYGRFHGTRVKEQVYAPDWTTHERVAYTNLLFDLLGEIVPDGVEGSVSTVPVSFKEFIQSPQQVRAARENLWKCVEHIERVGRRTGKTLHLGLEPEPLCYLETTAEAVEFIEQMRADLELEHARLGLAEPERSVFVQAETIEDDFLAEVVPPFLAAWLPPVLTALAAFTLLFYTEDG